MSAAGKSAPYSQAARWLAGCALLLLAACGSAPRVAETPEPAAPRPAAAPPIAQDESLAEFERTWRKRAELAGQQGRWADAAAAWEILVLLRPADRSYAARAAEARARGAEVAAQLVAAAAAARKRGEVERATGLYLKALAAEPQNRAAIQGLQDIGRAQAATIHARRQNGMRPPKPTDPNADDMR